MTKLKRYLRTVTVILIAALVGLTGYFVYSVLHRRRRASREHVAAFG